MRYKLASSDQNKVVLIFTMPERAFIIGFLTITAAACLLAGLAFAVSSGGEDDRLRALCLTGFGLFCFSAIFLFVAQFRPPRSLVFDNSAGLLVIHDRKDKVSGEVPYARIAGFSVCPSVSERILSHSVGLDLARGGRIELFATRRADRAKAFRDALDRRVTLSAAQASASGATRPIANDALDFTHPQPGVLAYEWSRRTRPMSLVVSLLVLLSFLGALVGSRPFASGPVGWIAALAFGAFFALAAAVSVLRTIGEHMSIRIDGRSLEFRRRSLLSRGSSFSLPLAQIAVVDFSMSLSQVATRITLLKVGEVRQLISYRQGTFRPAETIDMIGFLRRLPQIDVSALPAGQRFSLSEAIREKLLLSV